MRFYNYERLQAKLNGLSPMELGPRPLKTPLLFVLST
ncbi:hypothetical protein [Paenibacillus sp. Aloe-11]